MVRARVGLREIHRRCDVGAPGGTQRAYREVTQAGEYLRGGSFAELGSVFVVGEVADVV